MRWDSAKGGGPCKRPRQDSGFSRSIARQAKSTLNILRHSLIQSSAKTLKKTRGDNSGII